MANDSELSTESLLSAIALSATNLPRSSGIDEGPFMDAPSERWIRALKACKQADDFKSLAVEIPPRQLRNVLSTTVLERHESTPIVPGDFSKIRVRMRPLASIGVEFRFLLRALTIYDHVLKPAVIQQRALQRLMSVGATEFPLSELTALETQTGCCFALLQTTLQCSGDIGDPQAAEEAVVSALKDVEHHVLFRVLCHYELAIHQSAHPSHQLSNVIRELAGSDVLLRLWRMMRGDCLKLSIDEASRLSGVLGWFPVFDRYRAVMALLPTLCGQEVTGRLRTDLVAFLHCYADSDPRAAIALWEMGESDELTSNVDSSLEAWSLYTSGQPDRAVKSAINRMQSSGLDVSSVDVCAREIHHITVGGENRCRGIEIARTLATAATDTKDAISAAVDLRDLSARYASHPWRYGIDLLLAQLGYSEPSAHLSRCARLSGAPLSLLFAPPSPDSRKRYHDLLHKLNPSASAALAFRIDAYKAGLSERAHPNTGGALSTYFSARRSQHLGEHQLAAEGYMASIADSSEPVLRRRALVNLIDVCRESQKPAGALDQVVSDSLGGSHLPTELLRRTLTLVESASHTEIGASIDVPILADLYERRIDRHQHSTRADAFEDYMELNDLSLPSHLSTDIAPLSRVVYFLRFVCVPEVLDTTTLFDSTNAVEGERLRICRLLYGLDPDNEKAYQDEITQLASRRVLRESMLEVDERRVYVDESGLKASLERGFSPYYSLCRMRLVQSPDRLVQLTDLILEVARDPTAADKIQQLEGIGAQVIKRGLDTDGESPITILLNLYGPIEKTFDRLIWTIEHEFLHSRQHGLDVYLSTRIRHGSLAGVLRAPVMRAGLVPPGESGIAPASDSWGWSGRLANYTPAFQDAVEATIADFFEQFESTVRSLPEKRVRIRSPDYPDGALSCRLDRHRAQLRDMAIDQVEFPLFIDTAFGFMWQQLDDSLRLFRTWLKEKFRALLVARFEDLRESVVTLAHSHDVQPPKELLTAINQARVDVSSQVDIIARWFSRGSDEAGVSRPVSLAVEVARRAVEVVHQRRPEITEVHDSGFQVSPTRFRGFVDFFFTLLDNCMTHGEPGGSISVEMSLVKGELAIAVRNAIQADKDAEQVHSRAARSLADARRSMGRVAQEGGSGIQKIYRAAHVDVGQCRSFVCGVDQRVFFVEAIFAADISDSRQR